jgi:CheY-like chemotaxis protein
MQVPPRGRVPGRTATPEPIYNHAALRRIHIVDHPETFMSDPAARAGRHRILVVDDNVDSAESMSVLLRLEGHDTRVMHEGEGVVDAVRQYRPDLVLLDIGLPGVSGYDVAAQLRADPAIGDATVLVAVSGYGRAEDRERSQRVGFHHHLVKPVDFSALHAILQALPPLRA